MPIAEPFSYTHMTLPTICSLKKSEVAASSALGLSCSSRVLGHVNQRHAPSPVRPLSLSLVPFLLIVFAFCRMPIAAHHEYALLTLHVIICLAGARHAAIGLAVCTISGLC